MHAQLLILDFGSQYTQLIARAVRELGVYCEILPGTAVAETILKKMPRALILSGGPASVRSEEAPKASAEIFHADIPILGICYGMQLIAREFGSNIEGWGRDALSGAGTKENGAIREFGPAVVTVLNPLGPFSFLSQHAEISVWMSHGDKVSSLPKGFQAVADSPGSPVAAFADEVRKIYGVQFHPEVHHTPLGKEILRGFLFDVAKLEQDWDPFDFVNSTIASIQKKVPTGNVVCALSGGVDSTVAAVLVHRALGDRLHCIFVDNGLLRHKEAQQILHSLRELKLKVKMVEAEKEFLSELVGVVDPEQKRKVIGRVFIEVFEREAKEISDVHFLVQGTLYPDVIESVSIVGKSVTIKSHHNVGGLTENMKLKLIEPLRELFKDEVRLIGRSLGIPENIIARQPFPGPGLGVRCLGEITEERLNKLRLADSIVQEEVEGAKLSQIVWQAFAVLLPVKSVGVMGDGRTFEEAIAIRSVTSRDAMTADWYLLPEDVLRRISTRIVNEIPGVNRVVFDISTKPPATIEWE